jgi:corrinoid protein of di/trimethylamine methyltransferase
MTTDGLFAEMKESIIGGDRDAAVRLAQQALQQGVDAAEAINEGFVKGIQIVGERYGNEEIFLPELVMAADAMMSATDLLQAAIRESGDSVRFAGRGIAGTVEGDIHEIGIRLVTAMLVANGYDVHYLGCDVPASQFVEKAVELQPDLILLSALLTTTMVHQREVIEALDEAGLRSRVRVLVGGAPVTEDWARQIGADGYGEDAADAVRRVKALR